MAKVCSMTSEDFLDIEDFWKDDFDVVFFRHNEDGTEWWAVRDKVTDNLVHCHSMLADFKIAYTAKEILAYDEKETVLNGLFKTKAEWLLVESDKYKLERELLYHNLNGGM